MNCKQCGRALVDCPVLSSRGIDFRPMCPTCQNEELESLQRRNNTSVLSTMLESGVPKGFANCRLSESDLLFKGRQDVDDGKTGLFLLGNSGVGKTRMLVGWCARMVAFGHRVRFVDFSDFMCAVRSDNRKYLELKDPLLASGCLFLDNFDASNRFLYEYVFNLVNALYREGIQVFYASETLPEQPQLAMRIGATTIQLELVKRSQS